jgi:hypothetical protein
LRTIGGVAPDEECRAALVGATREVLYSAQYVFFKAAK